MFKYMKYEIKGTYKYILGILALVLILTTVLYGYSSRITGEMSDSGGMFIGLSVMILFGTALATFLYIVGSFRKELYEDRGYLTFTLPLTGNQIVGSKLIVALMWFVVLAMTVLVYNVIMILSFSPAEINLSDLFMIADFISIRGVVFNIVYSILSMVAILVVIYFSMALSKVTFRNKKIGGLWFLIFLLLSALIAYGEFKITEVLPYYFNLDTLSIGTMDTLFMASTNIGMATTNIAGDVYNIVITVLLFLGTGYLIERKIDL